METAIDRAIKAEDMIADEASPALADIRRKIRQTNNKIKDILQSYTGSTRAAYLQDNVVTMRNGRYVVPVKAEYKNDVKGLVHDTSSSGATLFIEPMAVIEANNELRTLQSREEREIDRILSELSVAVSEQSGILRLDYHTITELAFYFAEGSLADKMKANQPMVADRPLIDLKRARHPLIDPKKVVPTDVSLGEDYDTLIITGPNTGGKTVTLKTLGLFVLMAQAGLQIPAEEESRIGVFSNVLADVGDEQSIEQSLSTFSSHMVNIVGILGQVGEGTLVLFDELGAGTDPRARRPPRRRTTPNSRRTRLKRPGFRTPPASSTSIRSVRPINSSSERPENPTPSPFRNDSVFRKRSCLRRKPAYRTKTDGSRT